MNRMLKHRRAAAAGIAALGCAIVVPVATSAAASEPKVVTKKVNVGDDFFKPTKLTINKKNAINFVWNKSNFDSHNVTLIKGPKGVKPFASDIANSGYTFKRKLTKAGTYQFDCSLHNEMTLRIKVR